MEQCLATTHGQRPKTGTLWPLDGIQDALEASELAKKDKERKEVTYHTGGVVEWTSCVAHAMEQAQTLE